MSWPSYNLATTNAIDSPLKKAHLPVYCIYICCNTSSTGKLPANALPSPLLYCHRCRSLTSSQSKEGRRTLRRGSSRSCQVIARTTATVISTGSHINNACQALARHRYELVTDARLCRARPLPVWMSRLLLTWPFPATLTSRPRL